MRASLLAKYEQICTHELREKCLPFWLTYSVDAPKADGKDSKAASSSSSAAAGPKGVSDSDRGFGGYFNCLTEDGVVYDTTKHMWLNARQVWTLSRIALGTADPAKRKELLDGTAYPVCFGFGFCCVHFLTNLSFPLLSSAAAKVGADFLVKYARTPDNKRVYFALSAQGVSWCRFCCSILWWYSKLIECFGCAETGATAAQIVF